MRLARRAACAPTAASPAAQLPLRAQALVPFAVALALVVALAAVGAAFVARSAVERELRAQAETARHLVGAELAQVEQRLAGESRELATGADARSPRALERQLLEFADRDRLTLAAVVEPGAAGRAQGRPGADGRRSRGVAAAAVRALADRPGP